MNFEMLTFGAKKLKKVEKKTKKKKGVANAPVKLTFSAP